MRIVAQRHSLFETDQMPELDADNIVLGTMLGAGGYGIVYR